MKLENLTETIIGTVYKVHNTLGFGFLESVYEESLMIELEKAGLDAKSQEEITVYYEGNEVGNFKADVVVEDLVVVELKSIRELATAHEVQLVNYLKATGREVGLLVNFGPEEAEVKRKVKDL